MFVSGRVDESHSKWDFRPWRRVVAAGEDRLMRTRRALIALAVGSFLLAAACTPPGPVGVLGTFDPTFQHFVREDPGQGWMLVRTSDNAAVRVDPQPAPSGPFRSNTVTPYWAPNGSRFALFSFDNGDYLANFSITFYGVPSGEGIVSYFLGSTDTAGGTIPFFNSSNLSGILFWAPDGSSATIRYPDGHTAVFSL